MSDNEEEATAAAAIPMGNIKDFTALKTLRIEKFKIPEDRLKIGHSWEEWLKDFEEEMWYMDPIRIFKYGFQFIMGDTMTEEIRKIEYKCII